MTYDDIMAGMAGESVRRVLMDTEQAWLELLTAERRRHNETAETWVRICDEWRKRAEAK